MDNRKVLTVFEGYVIIQSTIAELFSLLFSRTQEEKMNHFKRVLALILAVLTVMSMALTGCQEKDPAATDGTTGNGDSTKGSYTVNVKSAGGMAMSEVDVYIYVGSDLENYGKTDANGTVSFDLAVRSDYTVKLSGVPDGYAVAEGYSFTGNTADITLTSSVIAGEELSGATLGPGDVMYDFTVTDAYGNKVTLSEMLKEKDMVLLNFWYTTCSWCVTEFPYMEEAYQLYEDKVGIIALDPLDSEALIKPFQEDMKLSFPMASCPAAWSATFGIQGYPTSIVVDRYGVICLMESGALPSLRAFTGVFEHFTADNYKQKLFTSASELVTNVKPTYEMDTSENIGALINNGSINVTYRPETEGEDAEYAWPFVAAEYNGSSCLKASNQQIDGSYAILYADVELKAGQAVGFDYLVSSEKSADIMYVIVNDEPIYQISGVSENPSWQCCYPWVALEDGTYEVALCYIKDDSTNEGDDTVYIKNMRVLDAKDVDVTTFIPRYAATSEDGFAFDYVDIVFNEKDGYYHVGTADGPLLLADLMNYTQFNEELTIWDICYDGAAKAYYEEILNYFTLASNSSLSGVCTVTKGLADMLKKVAEVAGFDSEDKNEWLKICKYYQVYGAGDAQLEDPIVGLAPFSAFTATLGKNKENNYFYYDRIIMPRGMFAEFVPSKSGVYRITSRHESSQGVEGWIFDENLNELFVYEMSERMYNDDLNVSMVFYMEAGKSYYIDIAFWDPYEVGYIYYDIVYEAATMDIFRLASPGYFPYDTNATGDAMYHLIAGGIDVVLGTDGKYYEDLGKDAKGNQKYGSLLYADFTGITALFDTPISTVTTKDAQGNTVVIKGMIDKGGFDFSKTEEDLFVLGYLNKNNGDQEAAKAELKEVWGEDFETYAEDYKMEDVFAGRYHGTGKDYTEEMKGYLDDIITKGKEDCRGCVVVTERLAELLQMIMDKYTFADVDHSWTKLCYYYDHLGPEG